jgi:hypothetical protein
MRDLLSPLLGLLVESSSVIIGIGAYVGHDMMEAEYAVLGTEKVRDLTLGLLEVLPWMVILVLIFMLLWPML